MTEENAETEGLDAIAGDATVPPLGREFAIVASARGYGLGSLARALNEIDRQRDPDAKGGRQASNVAVQLRSKMQAPTIGLYQAVLQLPPEHVSLTIGEPLGDEAFSGWTKRMRRQLRLDGPDFVPGTAERVAIEMEADPVGARRFIEQYALTAYREKAGVFRGRGLNGTDLVEIAAGWHAPPSHLAVALAIPWLIEHHVIRKKSDDALSRVFLTMHGLVQSEMLDAIIAVCRAAIVQNGVDATGMDDHLRATRSSLGKAA